jgi:TonB family protein
MPEYPGGFDEMVNFIIDHVQYPDSAKKHRIEGRVLISFVVDSNGTLYDFVVEKSVSKDLDEEALRVCRLFPRFKPGIYHGKAVKSRFSIPMTFKLSEPEIKEEGPK